MNALPSFNPPPPRQSTRKRSPRTTRPSRIDRRDTQVKAQSNTAYAYRRQGLEAVIKLATYSTLSVFGISKLVNLLGYNWVHQTKLQQVSTQLKSAKVRTQKIQNSFSRSFDPRSQQSVVEENSYKTVPNRLAIIISPKQSQSTTTKSADSQ